MKIRELYNAKLLENLQLAYFFILVHTLDPRWPGVFHKFPSIFCRFVTILLNSLFRPAPTHNPPQLDTFYPL